MNKITLDQVVAAITAKLGVNTGMQVKHILAEMVKKAQKDNKAK